MSTSTTSATPAHAQDVAKKDDYTVPFFGTLRKLFLRKKFWAHRLFGASYLILWLFALCAYFYDYAWFKDSFVVWALPTNGVVQTLLAMYYFTFLPSVDDPGYYSDKSVMSYKFVCENLFYSGLLLFQSLYMHGSLYTFFRAQPLLENLFVFLPYAVIRPFVPKTRFRDSLQNAKNKTDANRTYFVIMTNVTRVFYMWAKHYMGFFLNYLRFQDKLTASEIYDINLMLVLSGFAVTISLFLHTLKFKGYMGPKLSFSLYAASYMSTFYTFYRIAPVFVKLLDITLITAVGLLVNYLGVRAQGVYQVCVMLLFNYRRFEDPVIPGFSDFVQNARAAIGV